MRSQAQKCELRLSSQMKSNAARAANLFIPFVTLNSRYMKICIIAPKAYQLFNQTVESTFGGAEVQLYLLANEIRTHGLDVDVITADYGQSAVEKYNGVYVKKSFAFTQHILKRFIKLFRVVRLSKADVFVQRTLTPFAAIMAIYSTFIGKKAVYMIAHDGEVSGTHSIYSSLFGRIAAWITFRLSSLVVTQNNFQQKILSKKRGVNAICIRSGYPLRSDTKKVEKTIDVLWIGRAERWKNPAAFLELASAFPDTQFTIIAPPATAEPDYASDVEKQASALPNVHYIASFPLSTLFGLTFKLSTGTPASAA